METRNKSKTASTMNHNTDDTNNGVCNKSQTTLPSANTVTNEQLYELLKGLSTNIETIQSTGATKEDVQKLSGTVDKISSNMSAALQKSEEALKVAKVAMQNANQYKEQCSVLQERLNKLEAYNRRENLIIEGITETDNENCKAVVLRFFSESLCISDAENILLQRVHRLPAANKKTRPIICRFALFSDRQKVWSARKKLKESNKFLREDYPSDYISRRNKLYPYMKKARDLKKLSFLKDDKLIIDSKQYSVDTIDSIPQEFHPTKGPATKFIGQDIVAFFTKDSPLSNFHASSFDLDGKTFPHVEQFFQYQKAINVERPDIAQKILNCDSPADCKRLGNTVKIDANEWLPKAKEVMYRACLAKFEQNKAEQKFLLETDNRIIAEACKDQIWGVGFSITNKMIENKTNWTGKNVTGDVLMSVRAKLSMQALGTEFAAF